MKNVILAFALSFICINTFAQSSDGKEEYDKAIIALEKHQDKKANKLLEESYKKGYEPACLKIQSTYWGSTYQRLEARKIAAEKGYPQWMFAYGVENIDNRDKLMDGSVLQPLATASVQDAYGYVAKAANAGYQPAYIYLGKKFEEAGELDWAVKMYQHLADTGDKEGIYKLAILKKDAKTALETAESAGDKYADGVFKSAMVSDDSKFVMELAKLYTEKSVGQNTLFEYRAGDLYGHACDLGSGEGCYKFGLRYLQDYRDHENGLPWFDKAIKFEFKVPQAEYLKMKNPPSAEEVAQMNARLQAQYERDALYAKNHPNGDEVQYKTNTPITKTKSSLTQADMDAIIKANFPSSSSEGERHRRAMEKQARDTEKINNGTWNGH